MEWKRHLKSETGRCARYYKNKENKYIKEVEINWQGLWKKIQICVEKKVDTGKRV